MQGGRPGRPAASPAASTARGQDRLRGPRRRGALLCLLAVAAAGSAVAGVWLRGAVATVPLSQEQISQAVSGTAAGTEHRLPPEASEGDAAPVSTATPAPSPLLAPDGPPAGFAQLTAALTALAADREVGISLVELGGPQPQRWSLAGDHVFFAASTYKLPTLMWNAEMLATGRVHSGDVICYQASDAEPGWFSDYAVGSCFTRQQLAVRIGRYSDNTAGHMLVRNLGGSAALNAYARRAGATHSSFFYPNTTTAGDLASLLVAEAGGARGGEAAQRWLYPLLTRTATVSEQGLAAGVPASATVMHKAGWADDVEHDAALVTGSPAGGYVVAVCTHGEVSWDFIARVSSRVWAYESRRS